MKKSVCSMVLFCAFLILSPGAAPRAEEAAFQTPPAPTPGKWQRFWLNRVEKFRAENKTLDPGKKNIVFLGDSLTQGFQLKEYFPELPALNRGIGSDGVCSYPSSEHSWRGVTHRMKDSVFDCNPSHLFFLIGTNDVGPESIPIEYWLGAYKYVIRQTRKVFPEVKIILVTCPPTGLKYKRHEHLNARLLEWNKLVQQCAKKEDCRLIDLYSLLVGEDGLLPDEMTRDGLHFNHLGFERWAKAVRQILIEDGVVKED